MDLQLVQKGIDFSRRRKKWLLILAGFGLTGYGVYKVYHLPSVVKKRRRLLKLIEAMNSVLEVVSDSAETMGVVSRDMKAFLESDSEEIPNSLKQLSKIARSKEFSESMVRVTEALTIGVLRGYQRSSGEDEFKRSSGSGSDFTDRVLDRIFSTAGNGFISVVVGSFAKNLVLAFYPENQEGEGSGEQSVSKLGSDLNSIPRWVNVVCSDKCRGVIADCIQLFVSTAVAVYLDKTMEINTYDELFSGLTNPKHETKVKDILVSVCNGAVETLVKTSHNVLSKTESESSPITSFENVLNGKKGEGSSLMENEGVEQEMFRNSFDENRENGWVNKMSSTLAVPSNRKLVLDVTGRVTFETVRSFLDFLLWKISDGVKRSFNFVHEEVVDRGIEAYRYVSAKSAAILTICFALCLHIVGGARVLMPA